MSIIVNHSGSFDARLAFFGEGPGEQEERLGLPFVGRSGEEVNDGLGGPAVRAMCFADNILPVRALEGAEAKEKRAAALHWTPNHLNQKLPYLEARTILTFGDLALWYFTGLTSIMRYHGSAFTREEVETLHRELGGPPRPPLPLGVHSLVASLHPSAALHAGSREWSREIKTNCRRAWDWSNQPIYTPGEKAWEVIITREAEEVEAELAGAPAFVFDLETLREDSRFITTGSVSARASRVLAFKWDERFQRVLKPFFESPRVTKIGHNSAAFDTLSLGANGIELDGSMFDTINAGSLLWVPIPNKQQQEAGRKQMATQRLALGKVCPRVFNNCVYWKEPDRRETQILYQCMRPDLLPHQYEEFYCGMDTGWTGRLHVAEVYMLREERLHNVYVQYEAPAALPLARMDMRGMGLDTVRQKWHRDREKATVARLKRLIRKEAEEFHATRKQDAEAEVERLTQDLEGVMATGVQRAGACPDHPTYEGRLKRTTCPGCAAVFEATAPERAKRREVQNLLGKAKTRLGRLVEGFDIEKDDHWRFLLFHEDGLNSGRSKDRQIEPPFFTDGGLARVNLEAMERLQKEHPDVELIKWRVEAQHALQVIRGILKIKPRPDGRVQFARSWSKTATGRSSAGRDDQEPGKNRKPPANINNIKKKFRDIFIARPEGWWIVDADWKQIELQIVAWHAQERSMLALLRAGGDIHVENAVLVAKALDMEVPTEGREAWSRATRFPSEVEDFTMRDAGKTLSHAWNFGMDRQSRWGAKKTARDFGIPLEKATAARDSYFQRWKAIDKFQDTVIWLAGKNHHLRSSFGRKSMEFRMKRVKGGWALADVEEALAFVPQSEPSSMMKVVMRLMEDWLRERREKGWGLWTTTYDELATECAAEDVAEVAAKTQEVMEREWPELGEVPGFGLFRCPADVTVGKNWGGFHRHTDGCKMGEGCGKFENLWGQRPLAEWRKEEILVAQS